MGIALCPPFYLPPISKTILHHHQYSPPQLPFTCTTICISLTAHSYPPSHPSHPLHIHLIHSTSILLIPNSILIIVDKISPSTPLGSQSFCCGIVGSHSFLLPLSSPRQTLPVSHLSPREKNP